MGQPQAVVYILDLLDSSRGGPCRTRTSCKEALFMFGCLNMNKTGDVVAFHNRALYSWYPASDISLWERTRLTTMTVSSSP